MTLLFYYAIVILLYSVVPSLVSEALACTGSVFTREKFHLGEKKLICNEVRRRKEKMREVRLLCYIITFSAFLYDLPSQLYLLSLFSCPLLKLFLFIYFGLRCGAWAQ